MMLVCAINIAGCILQLKIVKKTSNAAWNKTWLGTEIAETSYKAYEWV